ncbi:hypothetical protein [Pseudomonas sp. MWU13-2100]|uniref:hypothetical protein n=1 Tax=Pseudomonas sp. MWU13-2100 TaxID=2935075 RepID=UPI00200F0E07|nr:hypothetical protein [Pseudomonas sp. MWU13-2100]
MLRLESTNGPRLASLTPGAFIFPGLPLAARPAWKPGRSIKQNSRLSTQWNL